MTLTQLKALVGAYQHAPCSRVLINGTAVEALGIDIDMGYDTVSAAATITLATVPSWLAFRQSCEIRLGYDGHLEAVTFWGIIEDDGRGYFPFTNEIKAVGRLRLAQYDYPSEVSYTAQTDTVIVNDLLERAGITSGQRNVTGEGATFGVAEDVVLREGEPTWSLINRLDQVTGYKTWDNPDGVVQRRLISGIPTASASWTYTEGTNVLSIDRSRSSSAVRNKVVVNGLPLYDGTYAHEIRQADSAYVPDPPRYYAMQFSDDLIEDQDYAGTVGSRLMLRYNRLKDEIDLEVPGNPLVHPGDTIGVVSDRVGITASNYWLKHIRHRYDASGFTTRLTLEGGLGDAGYDPELDPVAAFTWACDRETLDLSGTATAVYTLTCDGSPSYDPDGEPGALNYSWSNNQNATGGTAVTYSTYFTAAQIGGTATVSLTVTDADANTDTLTQTITGGTANTLARTLYVAGGASAYATPDGGAAWREYAPAGDTIISTPEGAAIDGSTSYSYFGGQGGALYYTADALATTPLVHHSFGSPIECIWINETNRDRVAVGLYNGQIHATGDASAGTAATWAQLKSYANPVYWVAESPLQDGQYWVCTGNELRISFDGLATDAAYATFPAGTARHIANSFMGNFVNAFVPSGGTPVRDDADQAYGLAGTLSALWGCATHHLYDDRLWYAGGTGHWYERGPGSASFAYVSSIPDTAGTACGTVNHMVRDPGNQNVTYVAAEDGLFKTWDGGLTFARMLNLTAAGKRGLQVGVGSLRLSVKSGRFVWVCGVDGSTNPVVAYTTNVWEVSPTWALAGTGLPASAGAARDIRPFHDGAGAYVIANNAVYRLATLAGAWSKVLDQTIFEAALGSALTTFELSYIDAHDANFVVAQVTDTGVSPRVAYVAHSHDGGATWTAVLAYTYQHTAYNLRGGLWLDRANADLIRFHVAYGNLPYVKVIYSDDGGHTWTASAASGSTSSGYQRFLLSPANGSVFYVGTNFDNTQYSANKGATWAAQGAAGYYGAAGDVNDAAFCLARNSAHAWYRTLDAAATWQEVLSVGTNSNATGGDIWGNRYYYMGFNVADAGQATAQVHTSDETSGYTTTTNRTGNLASLMLNFGGFSGDGALVNYRALVVDRGV